MFKPVSLIIVSIIFLSGYWFYTNITTPQGDGKTRVTNLPWQITVVDPQTLHVFDLNIGQDTLGQAVKVLLSEYELAWFENKDQSISLEAYFLRVSLSGLRAKIILELDSENLDRVYLENNSGKPEVLKSHSIKYPLDDLAHVMSNKVIKSLTYLPKSSVDIDILQSRFGGAEELIFVNEEIEFLLYPSKGLLMKVYKSGKEAFQYVPLADFERLKQTALETLKASKQE